MQGCVCPPKCLGRVRGGHAGHVQVFETDIYEKMRNATNKFSKLYSQPRTHNGATREANTIASQKSAPLNTGLSIMFEIFIIYPGHLEAPLWGNTTEERYYKQTINKRETREKTDQLKSTEKWHNKSTKIQ